MKNSYRALSSVGFLSNRYTHKFLFVAFLGIHIPLIAIIIFVSSGIVPLSSMGIIVLTLVATLLATGITLYVLNGLLWPLHLGKRTLNDYLTEKKQPLLPTHYKDEAGVLLSSIQETIEKLDSLMEEKKDLISLFSHDMRTPTSQVVALSRLIKEEKEVKKVKEYVGMLEQISERQLVMLNDILVLLRAEHPYSEKEFELFPLAEWVKDCVRSLLVMAAQKNISFKLDLERAACNLRGERSLLMEALCNVLTNAIKFSYPNGMITINAQSVGDRCRVEVTDKGVGFQNSVAKKLFEKFTKYGKNGTAGEHSTGMGLYLTKTILHKHNGTIDAYSPGHEQGAVFTIDVPCK